MKKRNIAIMALLTIVTLGIYVPVWLYRTRQEIMRHTSRSKAIPPFILLLLPYLVLFVLLGISLATGSDASSSIFNSLILLLAGPVAIIGMFVIPLWWFYRYFTAVHEVTHGTDGMLLYVIWVLCVFIVFFPVWMLLVQNDLNKTAAQLDTPPHDMPLPDRSNYPPQPNPPAGTF
jgi:hypothetical protein